MSLQTNNARGVYLLLIALSLLLGGCGAGEQAASERDEVSGPGAGAPAQSRGNRSALAASSDEPRAVVSERLPYAEVEDELVYGYFVFPSDMIEPLPALIIIHEWWGLNDDVRSMADEYAAEGYIVLAVDLFAGKLASEPESARRLMLSVVEQPKPAMENIRQAYEFVKNTAGAPRVAALGRGFGGVWALNTAILLPDELDAAVIYYGQITDDEDELRPVNAAILGLFGAQDPGIAADSVERFQTVLGRLRKDFEVIVYPDVSHSFASPLHRNYSADAAGRARDRTLAFLREKLTRADR